MTDAPDELVPLLVHQIEPAPGRGIIPGTSPHVPGEVHLLSVDAQPAEEVSEGLTRQYVVGANSTFVKWTGKKGAVVPLHHHGNEQLTWITEGHVEVYSQGRKYTMRGGDLMVIPPNVPHEFHFIEDSIDIDIFAPGRQDWLDGTASYYDQK